ncbi:unnamed protein product [Hyaloperonospora brassicae]|uniref:Uncharacterized protein n=1 Tax=Hyaloperonospora brassicae TaxID=162125 RepID=A0AAV0TJ71_HYABA|nr:unnamed protein product [Hyaloperonospora brassicae]
MMVEARYTSVMRSMRSGNYYNVPIRSDASAMATVAATLDDPLESEAAGAAWGTTTMRRLPAVAKRRDLNVALDSVAPSKDPTAFQLAFAFDLNTLVASLTAGLSSSSHSSSFTSSTHSASAGEPVPEPVPETSRIALLPLGGTGLENDATPLLRQRRRRGALSGEDDLARSYAPSSSSSSSSSTTTTSASAPNSIIAYSLHKRKQKRLAAKALAAASGVHGPNFEVAVADAGKEHQPQYVPRYVPQYQSDVTFVGPSRHREPVALDQQSYAL